MLATCVAAGWDIAGYRDPSHPLQRALAATVVELTDVPVAHVAVDGCGAPLFSSTPAGLARALARIAAAPAGTAEGTVAAAMRTHPWWVAGTGRTATRLCAAVPGLMAKDGAEGVFVAALPDGRAVVLKVLDGSVRPVAAVVVAALRALGVDDPGAGRRRRRRRAGDGQPRRAPRPPPCRRMTVRVEEDRHVQTMSSPAPARTRGRIGWAALAPAAVYLAVRVVGVTVLGLMAAARGTTLLGELRSWDGAWMLAIAARGYEGVPPTLVDAFGRHTPETAYAFFPGYPAAVATVGLLTGGNLVAAALIVSVVAGVVAAYGLMRLVEALPPDLVSDDRAAWGSCSSRCSRRPRWAWC